VVNGTEASDRGLGAYAAGNSSIYMNGQRQQGTQGVITQVARKNIKNVDDFEAALDENRGKSVGLTVKDSKGDSRFFALKVPKD